MDSLTPIKAQVPEDIFSSTHGNNLFPVWNASLY